MNNMYTFHKTVIGHLHIKKEIPCEDYSEAFFDKEKNYHIAVVADGHGDPACIRSSYGSRAVVEAALSCLKEFADSVWESDCFYQELKINREQNFHIRRLTNAIISRWQEAIEEDLQEHPLTEEELEQSGTYQEMYRKGEKLNHIYGTTLIAALKIKDLLILLQQGDGRCNVFYDDGTAEQPIPWDSRCVGNVTTSMCDDDVVTGIRHCVLFLETDSEEGNQTKRRFAACYLGSDGVEDSFVDSEIDMAGNYIFYKERTCDLLEKGTQAFEAYLEEILPDFSAEGSGDDVSIAGIVDLSVMEGMKEIYQKQIEIYTLQDSMRVYEQKLISMSRKHGILKKRAQEAKESYDETLQKLDEAAIKQRKIKIGLEKKQTVLQLLPDRVKILEEELKKYEKYIHTLHQNKEEASERYESKKKEFEEYDAQYQNIDEKCKSISLQILSLEHKLPEKSVKESQPVEEESAGQSEQTGEGNDHRETADHIE